MVALGFEYFSAAKWLEYSLVSTDRYGGFIFLNMFTFQR